MFHLQCYGTWNICGQVAQPPAADFGSSLLGFACLSDLFGSPWTLLGLWCARLVKKQVAGAVRCPTGLERRPEPWYWAPPVVLGGFGVRSTVTSAESQRNLRLVAEQPLLTKSACCLSNSLLCFTAVFLCLLVSIPCGYSDGARISHTLRQDRVQGEEGKRRNQTVETRAVTC